MIVLTIRCERCPRSAKFDMSWKEFRSLRYRDSTYGAENIYGRVCQAWAQHESKLVCVPCQQELATLLESAKADWLAR